MGRLESIKERLNKSTQGPWRWGSWSTNFTNMEPENIGDRLTLEHAPYYKQNEADIRLAEHKPIRILYTDEEVDENNAHFIAHAPEDIAYLLQRLERYEAVLRDISSNYDCDSDAHKYGTICRKCDAKEALKE